MQSRTNIFLHLNGVTLRFTPPGEKIVESVGKVNLPFLEPDIIRKHVLEIHEMGSGPLNCGKND